MIYILAIFMGFLLGMLGGGGSILTVPILVYVGNIPAQNATGYSLFIVGVTALIGSIINMRKSLVRTREGLVFAVPALLTMYAMRAGILPMIPETVILPLVSVEKATLIMIVFSIVMMIAGIRMLRQQIQQHTPSNLNYIHIIISGAIVGIVTGFVGAGGGFLIVPALVLLLRLPIREATATSLFVITLNSMVGFSGDIISGANFDWNIMGIFTAVSILGMIIGIKIATIINPQKIKTIFAWFIMVMSVFILTKELFFHS
ncbi:MAG TPA: sulfite exporter TauE/SafE family protein [Candidatus Kapabacteria bacterium]|jgi:uncharacterized membrane protein YfcA|nr:sulfite exporter TauE/SafE family protein [Candidatus Kapabacteria bacterium]